MSYRDIFTNQYLRISISTNSKQIRRLVANFLDLESNPCIEKDQIKINFYINEKNDISQNTSGKFLYQNKLAEKNKLFSAMSNNAVTIEVDAKAGVVNARLSGYGDLSKESVLNFILVRPLHFILMHRGFFFLHASAVSRGDDCILISGLQGSGKSTLALLLSQGRFNFFSDDDCFIKLHKGQSRVFPFLTKIGLNRGLLKKCPALGKVVLKNYYYGGKPRFSIKSISRAYDKRDLRCKMILFLNYQASSDIQIKKISTSRSLDKLIRANKIDGHGKAELQKRFWALYDLTRRATSYELIFNDGYLKDLPGSISKLFLK